MKYIKITIVSFFLTISFTKAQSFDTEHKKDSLNQISEPKTEKPIWNNSQSKSDSYTNSQLDSIYFESANGVIRSNVNKDGVIEISKSDFQKIPADRQEALKKDKNYKIVEEIKH